MLIPQDATEAPHPLRDGRRRRGRKLNASEARQACVRCHVMEEDSKHLGMKWRPELSGAPAKAYIQNGEITTGLAACIARIHHRPTSSRFTIRTKATSAFHALR